MKRNIEVTINGVTINYMIYGCWGGNGYEIIADNGMRKNLGVRFETIEAAEAEIMAIVAAKIKFLQELGLETKMNCVSQFFF